MPTPFFSMLTAFCRKKYTQFEPLIIHQKPPRNRRFSFVSPVSSFSAISRQRTFQGFDCLCIKYHLMNISMVFIRSTRSSMQSATNSTSTPFREKRYLTHSFTLYVCGCHFSYGLSSSSCLESKESFHALHSL